MTTSGVYSAGTGIGVGLLGLGLVGSAVARALGRRVDSPSGSCLQLIGGLVRDRDKLRDVPIDRKAIHSDPSAILNDPQVSIVVELMGGEDPAFAYLKQAIRAGKHVVTANKELLSTRGRELLNMAAEHGVHLEYEASVGGGVPIIGPLSNDLQANEVISLRGIINGTSNYILTRMEADGASFADALNEAQDLGYAEADPSSDVDGLDALYKMVILARIAFRTELPLSSIHCEGIRGVNAKDFRYANSLGYTIKLLAVARHEKDGLLARVHPALVPLSVPMATVSGVLNAVEVEGDLVGSLWFQGRGAGADPTASAVIGDIIRIARACLAGNVHTYDAISDNGLPIVTMDKHVCQYYMCIEALDQPGVLAKIAGILGELEISIHSVMQMDEDGEQGTADLVIMTHPACEDKMRAAVARIRDLDVVVSLANPLRAESYGSIG